MSEIMLMKAGDVPLDDSIKKALNVLFEQSVVGVDSDNQRRWRKFLRTVFGGEIGECFAFAFKFPRSGKHHRRHMLLESRVFQAQERVKDFAQFRYWLKVGSGFVDWMPGPKGGVFPIPKSISYANADQDEFFAYAKDAIAFLSTDHAAKYLWPHLEQVKANDCMAVVLSEFNQ